MKGGERWKVKPSTELEPDEENELSTEGGGNDDFTLDAAIIAGPVFSSNVNYSFSKNPEDLKTLVTKLHWTRTKAVWAADINQQPDSITIPKVFKLAVIVTLSQLFNYAIDKIIQSLLLLDWFRRRRPTTRTQLSHLDEWAVLPHH